MPVRGTRQICPVHSFHPRQSIDSFQVLWNEMEFVPLHDFLVEYGESMEVGVLTLVSEGWVSG